MRRRWLWWGAWKGGCRTVFEEKEKGRREGGKKVKADSAAAATAKCQVAGRTAGNEWKRTRGSAAVVDRASSAAFCC